MYREDWKTNFDYHTWKMYRDRYELTKGNPDDDPLCTIWKLGIDIVNKGGTAKDVDDMLKLFWHADPGTRHVAQTIHYKWLLEM